MKRLFSLSPLCLRGFSVLLAIANCALFTACGRDQSVPTSLNLNAIPTQDFLLFHDRSNSFSMPIPRGWKVVESSEFFAPQLTFIASTDSVKQIETVVTVTSYPNQVDVFRTAQDYLQRLKLVDIYPRGVRSGQINGLKYTAFSIDPSLSAGHGRRRINLRRENTVLMETSSQLFQLTLTSTHENDPLIQRIFESMVAGFRVNH